MLFIIKLLTKTTTTYRNTLNINKRERERKIYIINNNLYQNTSNNNFRN